MTPTPTVREALEPFAIVADWLAPNWQDHEDQWPRALDGNLSEVGPPIPTVGDLRRARAVYDAFPAFPDNTSGGRVRVPSGQTPLNEKLGHRYLDVFNEGQRARDEGTASPYHGHSLEHCLHAWGWVLRDLRLALNAAKAAPSAPAPAGDDLAGVRVSIEHDGFSGDVIGRYTTREGKRGVVLQQVGTKVVHVYGEKWIKPALVTQPTNSPQDEAAPDAERELSEILMVLGTETEMTRDDIKTAMDEHPQFANEILEFGFQWVMAQDLPTQTPEPVAPQDETAGGEAVARKFRKTALIEAVQWWKIGDHPAVRLTDDVTEALATGHAVPWCPTLEGGHVVTPGDWIATGVKGEHWPIKPDVFAATYEPADPSGVHDHAWPDCLDPNAAHNRRPSTAELKAEIERRINAENDRDRFLEGQVLMEKRATTAERDLAETQKRLEAAEAALRQSNDAIAEYYRYQTGGETRGSYDGKPERQGLWKALWDGRAVLTPTKPEDAR